MPALLRRTAAALTAALAGALGVLLVPGAAGAAPATDRTFTLAGDPGDFVTAGGSYGYSAAGGDSIVPTLVTSSTLRIRVDAPNGDDWWLQLAAPTGQDLAPGAYPGAERFAGARPGLDLTGGGRGCNAVTGSFTISTLVVADGRVTALDADFEQHCEGAPPAARGRVHIAGPAAAPLQLGIDVTGGSVDAGGDAALTGTLTCTEDVRVNVHGVLTQPADRDPVGYYQAFVDCAPGAAQPWTVDVRRVGSQPFRAGEASTEATAEATDPGDGSRVEAYSHATVVLAG
jgi:hypothetical protein